MGTENLVENHASLIMRMLGLLPLWIIDFMVVFNKAKPIYWFNKNMSMKKVLKGAKLPRSVCGNRGWLLKLACFHLTFSV